MNTGPIIDCPLTQELRRMPAERGFAHLINSLTSADKARRDVAKELLIRCGWPVIPGLVQEAFLPGRRAADAVRLLDIVGQIGGPVGADDWMIIASGVASRSKRLRNTAMRLLAALGHAAADSVG